MCDFNISILKSVDDSKIQFKFIKINTSNQHTQNLKQLLYHVLDGDNVGLHTNELMRVWSVAILS